MLSTSGNEDGFGGSTSLPEPDGAVDVESGEIVAIVIGAVSTGGADTSSAKAQPRT